MRNFLKVSWFKLLILLIIIGTIIASFYLYVSMPMSIRQDCFNSVTAKRSNISSGTEAERRAEFNFMYNNCLNMHGLEK